MNEPWDTFDKLFGRFRDALAGVGVVALIAAIGYFTAR